MCELALLYTLECIFCSLSSEDFEIGLQETVVKKLDEHDKQQESGQLADIYLRHVYLRTHC